MTTTTDFVSVLGTYWDEAPLRAFLTSLGISGAPKVKRGDKAGFLHANALGVELTFYREESIRVKLRDYPEGALVLYNIRFYGEKSGSLERYEGALPFGLRFGASRDSLIQDLGPPDSDRPDIPSMRWDTERYSVFANLSGDGSLASLAVQLPLVKTTKPAHAR